MPVKVILDSNFLMLFPRFFGDLFEELDKAIGHRTEKIILKPVYEELKKISLEDALKTRKQAETVLKLVETGEFKILNIELKPLETVDELIVRAAEVWKCFVATNDRELRRRLIKLGVPVVYLRQGNRLEIKPNILDLNAKGLTQGWLP